MPVVYRPHPLFQHNSMQMRLRMLKHCVGKGRQVMKQLHVCLIVLQYDAIVATESAGYVLYYYSTALVIDIVLAKKLQMNVCTQKINYIYGP